MDSTASSEPLTPRSTGAPAMIERRSSFVLEGASTKLVDDLAKAAALRAPMLFSDVPNSCAAPRPSAKKPKSPRRPEQNTCT